MQQHTESIDVRPVQPHELMELVELYGELYAVAEEPAPDAKLRQQWEALIADPKIHCLVADVGGTLVGSCTMIILPNLTRCARPYGLIENVVTHPAWRRRGIGTHMLATALETAWAHDCYKVMLLTGSKLESTLRFYEQAGFQRDVKTGLIAYPDDRAP